MVTPMRSSPLAALAALAALASSAACFVGTPPRDPYGDIAFDWSFAGETDCDRAGVDEVDIDVVRGGEVVLSIEEEPCFGRGLVLTEILEGVYDVFIDAYDRNGVLLYAGHFNVRVRGGERTEAGLVSLDAVGPRPAPAPKVGALAFFWSFQYPIDDNIVIDCALAGVNEVDIILTPRGTGGTPFEATRPCTEEGIAISQLREGRYDLEILGFGRFQGQDILLYDSGLLVVDILADQVRELGDLALPRVAEAFADFNVSWSFLNASCASAGVSRVTLSFLRAGFAEAEDVFEVDCTVSSVLRRTFVPGRYTVSARAVGASAVFTSATVVDVPPASLADVALVLSPT
jgi:hypothetical protein